VTSETLRIDEYFKNLLRQIPINVNIVELDSSGKWTAVGQDEGDGGETTDDDDMQIDSNSKRSSLPSTSSKSDKASAAIIILDDDDEPEPQISNNQQQVPPLLQNNVQSLPSLPTPTLPTFSQPQRPKAVRQSSTPGVPYMQHRPNIQTNDQLSSTILIPSPPSANITSTTLMQSPPDTTIYMDPTRTNNNTRKRKTPAQKRKSRRKESEVASQEKGNNSSTKDGNNNDNENNDNSSSGRSNKWSIVMGITPSQPNYHTLLSQDIVSQTAATQVASPISPVSVTNPNYSHPIQDEEEEGEWLTEDEQEEVVLDSTAAARSTIFLGRIG